MSANRITAAAREVFAALVLCAGAGGTAYDDDTTAPEPESAGGEAGC